MLIVNQYEAVLIALGLKLYSLRPLRANGKGYLRSGTIQQIYIGRDFKSPPYCRVLIIGREFVNVDDLSEADFLALGYRSKAEYMEQPYNQRNPSPERVKYTFIPLSHLHKFEGVKP